MLNTGPHSPGQESCKRCDIEWIDWMWSQHEIDLLIDTHRHMMAMPATDREYQAWLDQEAPRVAPKENS